MVEQNLRQYFGWNRKKGTSAVSGVITAMEDPVQSRYQDYSTENNIRVRITAPTGNPQAKTAALLAQTRRLFIPLHPQASKVYPHIISPQPQQRKPHRHIYPTNMYSESSRESRHLDINNRKVPKAEPSMVPPRL